MKRKLTISTAAVLTTMLIASLTSSDLGFMLMMSSAPEHNIARIVLIAALAAIVMTSQPRSKVFRAGLAIISAGVTTYALTQTANYELQLFDTLAYLLAAVILMTESLESEHTIVLSSGNQRVTT